MTQQAPDSRPAVVAAVIVQYGRVLLVQRAVAEGSLSWQFPAGEVEDGESAEDAAVRETLEEAGLTVVAKETLGERVHPATGRSMVYVACEVIDGTAHAADIDEVAQVAWCELRTLPTYVPHGFYEPVQRHLETALTVDAPTSAVDAEADEGDSDGRQEGLPHLPRQRR